MYCREREEEKKGRKGRKRVRVKGDRRKRLVFLLFLRKMNHALSPLLTKEREKD
jgi:hypothetical protein